MVLSRGYYPDFLRHTPIRLTKNELSDPMSVLKLFFENFDLNDVRHGLEDLKTIAVSADLHCLEDPFKRNSIEFLVSEILGLVEGCYLICDKAKKVEKPFKKGKSAK